MAIQKQFYFEYINVDRFGSFEKEWASIIDCDKVFSMKMGKANHLLRLTFCCGWFMALRFSNSDAKYTLQPMMTKV